MSTENYSFAVYLSGDRYLTKSGTIAFGSASAKVFINEHEATEAAVKHGGYVVLYAPLTLTPTTPDLLERKERRR